MNRREEKILNDVPEILKKQLNPSKIVLFGSRAKKNARVSSDFDFAVQCNGITEEKKRNIREAIEDMAGLYSVDIIYLDEVDDDFRKIIINSGKVIYERRT